MIASGRTAFATSGRISGSGFASARISGSLRHRLDHVLGQHPRAGKPEKDVGAANRVGERARLRVPRIARLVLFHRRIARRRRCTPLLSQAMTFSRFSPTRTMQIEAGDRRGAGARAHQLDLGDVLADDLEPVEDRRPGDDRGAVLVVVEHRDLHPLAELALDVEAVGRLDVLEVDAAERRLEPRDRLRPSSSGSVSASSMSKTSMPENFLNRQALPSITGLPASGPMLPRPSTAVPLVTTATRLPREVSERASAGSRGDRVAGRGHTRRIGEREVALVDQRLRRSHRNLAGRRQAVIFEGGGAQLLIHLGPPPARDGPVRDRFYCGRKHRPDSAPKDGRAPQKKRKAILAGVVVPGAHPPCADGTAHVSRVGLAGGQDARCGVTTSVWASMLLSASFSIDCARSVLPAAS